MTSLRRTARSEWRHLRVGATKAVCAAVALGTSAVVGAMLAVIIVDRRLTALPDLIWRRIWRVEGSPRGPDFVDTSWWIEAEWKYAMFAAIISAGVCALLWFVISRFRRMQRWSAAIMAVTVVPMFAPHGPVEIYRGAFADFDGVLVLWIAALAVAVSQMTYGIYQLLTRSVR